MKIGQRKRTDLGRRLSYPIAYFNIDSIYSSDESVDSDVFFSDTIKIIRYSKGFRIRAKSYESVYYIDLDYGELKKIIVVDPDECDMPKRERSSLSNVMFGWANGLASLHNTKLKIGGRIEFHYGKDRQTQQIILYHSKQDIFDMFKYVRKRFGRFLLDNDK